MESCKQIASCNEEKISLAGLKEVESSFLSCYGAHNLQEEIKCSMCGDVGLPHYLFKCHTCSHRYQHVYCSKFYPYTTEATICNWCLPMEQLGGTKCEVVDRTDMRVSNINSVGITIPYIQANSNCLIDTQVYTFELKHAKAFECLLRVAELYEQGHQWDSPGACICPINDDDCINGALSEKNSVRHLQNNVNLYDVGHNGNKLSSNQQPVSLMMHHPIFSGCSDEKDRSLDARRGEDKIEYVSRPSGTSSAHPWHNRNHACACKSQEQTVLMNRDVRHSQTIKNTLDQDLGHDRIRRNASSSQDLGYIQTIQKLAGEVDQAHELAQKLVIHQVKDHKVACTCSADQCFTCSDDDAKNSVFKQKQLLQTAVGSITDYSVNAPDQQRIQCQVAYSLCSEINNYDPGAGKFTLSVWQSAGYNDLGPAKRPRLQHSETHSTAGDEDIFNSAVLQWGDKLARRDNDLLTTATEGQLRSLLNVKQSSPPHMPHTWNRSRAGGKREHHMNSSSRAAIKCRYKLLADVLC